MLSASCAVRCGGGVGVLAGVGRLLFALGVVLILVGAVAVASWDPEPAVLARYERVRIQELELRPPGVLWLNETRVVARDVVRADPAEGPLVASARLTPPPEECVVTERRVSYGLEGTVEPGEATLHVRLEALLGSGERVVLREYTASVPALPPAGGNAQTAAYITVDGETVGSVALRGAAGPVDITLKPASVELPLDAVNVTLTVTLPLQGDVTAEVIVWERCSKAYNVDQPFLAPAGYKTLEIPRPLKVRMDTEQLSLGVALIAAGNAAALTGLYINGARQGATGGAAPGRPRLERS